MPLCIPKCPTYNFTELKIQSDAPTKLEALVRVEKAEIPFGIFKSQKLTIETKNFPTSIKWKEWDFLFAQAKTVKNLDIDITYKPIFEIKFLHDIRDPNPLRESKYMVPMGFNSYEIANTKMITWECYGNVSMKYIQGVNVKITNYVAKKTIIFYI